MPGPKKKVTKRKRRAEDEKKPLTDLAIRALKPKSVRYYKHDHGCPGLWLEVFPSGTLAWRYRYRLNGKAEKVAIGKFPDVNLKTARQKRDELAGKVSKGQSPASQKQLSKIALASTSSVREFGERYFKEVVIPDRKDTTIPRRYLDREVYPAFGAKALGDVTPAEVQILVFRKRDNGFPAAAAVIRNLVKRLYDYAIVCGVASINPTLATPTRFVFRARTRKRALSSEEIATYIQSLYRSNIRRQFKLALHMILLTMVRKSDLLLAKWNDFDLEKGRWEIPAETATKSDDPHIVDLPRQVIDICYELRMLAGNSEFVLPGRGSLTKPFAKNAINKALQGVNFDIEPFTIHDMRRTASTQLNGMKFPADVIERALNHTIGGVRGIYNRAKYAEERKEMLQVWADYVETLATDSVKNLFADRRQDR
jgi:integrase